MKRLTCEMCGSTDLIKQDGVFVCQSCGCKYSVEEARKLMIEGPVEVHGTVQVDRNAELENRLKNAVSEYDAKNFERAATLFTEILNIDSNNAMAIAYQAAADRSEHANMQDTMLHRTVNEFTRAVNCSKELKDPELFYRCSCFEIESFSTVLTGLLQLGLNHANELKNSINNLRARKMQTEREAKGLIPWNEPGLTMKRQIHEYEVMINTIQTELDAFVTSYTNELLKNAIDLGNVLCSMALEFGQIQESFTRALKSYLEICESLSSRGPVSGRQLVNLLKNKLKAITQIMDEEQESEKKRRRDAYWNEHKEEKERLENRLQELIKLLEPYDNEIERKENQIKELDIIATDEIEKIKSEHKIKMKEISSLRIEKGSLGMFKNKEKKELQEKIDKLLSQTPTTEEIDLETSKIKTRINDEKRSFINEILKLKNESARYRDEFNAIKMEIEKDRNP